MTYSQKLIALLFQMALVLSVSAQTKSLVPIPEIKKFQFKSIQTKTVPGLISERELTDQINENEKIGNLAVVLYSPDKPDGYIYKDGNYNSSNYKVEQGEVRDKSGKIVLPAFRIFPSEKKAEKFVASASGVFIKLPSIEDYTIYQLADDAVLKLVEIKGASIKKDGYTKIPDLVASDLSKPITLFYEASKKKFSIFTTLAPGVEAAQVLSNPFFRVTKYRYRVDQSPYDFTVQTSDPRKFFLSPLANDKVALVWQTSDQSKITRTVFGADLKSYSNTSLDKTPTSKLVAAATSLNGTSYYVTMDNSEGAPVGMLYRSKPGEAISTKQPLSLKQSDLNVYSYSNEFANLEISRDTLLLMIARRMHTSPDGLNHQGGIAVKFDANSLQTIKNFGQTSGHSFDNFCTLNAQGDFIAMDLGDNYPRGVNLHTFKNYLRSSVVYTFKTEHGTTADCWGIATYPEYTEISTKEKKYYRWSNDNNTYTELGGIADTGDGYLVSFCGEPDEKGFSLDNRKSEMAMPRNVGFVKVAKNYFALDETTDKIILSEGITEVGGFYTFGGRWSQQKNTGVVWLTHYLSSDQTARHLKTVKLQNGNVLFAWELWTSNQYDKTYALVIDSNGKKVSDIIELGSQVRLHRRDDPLVMGKKVIFASASQVDQMLELVVVESMP